MISASDRKEIAFLIVVLALGFAMRVAVDVSARGVGQNFSALEVARSLWFALETLAPALFVYFWLGERGKFPAARIAIVVLAFYPGLIFIGHDTPQAEHVNGMGLLILTFGAIAGPQPNLRSAGKFVLLLWGATMLPLGIVGSWSNDATWWSFWQLADAAAPLRSVLAAYLTDGIVFGLSVVGAYYSLRENWRPWALPFSCIAFTWLVSLRLSAMEAQAMRTVVLPVLVGFAAMGAWRIYAGMGRSGGHGILAVDVVRDKPRKTSAGG